jgi:hypothetical protein
MKIISYPERHDPEDFADHHLPEILERGFDTILFPICEQTWQYNLSNIKEMREIAEAAGLDTWAGPWALAGIFGGEAISTLRPGREGNVFFELWKADVIAAGFRTIFLDEPNVDCDPDVMYEWYQIQRLTTMPEVRLVTTLADDMFDAFSDEQIRTLPVDSVGLSCYHWTKDVSKITRRTLMWTGRLARLRPRDNHVWIQGFDIEAGCEWIPVMVKQLARTMGITNFGHWSFRASRCVATKTPPNWREVWDTMYD